MNTSNLYCFVCDIAVTNRYFSLAACRTQTSKKKLIEKLGHLVGDTFMVVITEDDVICRSCANLMNTLDRLEIEMSSVRRVVLRFLERKYSLKEGTLLSQVINSSNNVALPEEKTVTPNFMLRKKKAEEEMDTLTNAECNADDPRGRIWMQCNKCQYTTNYTSFVNNHIRKEVCLNCEAPVKDGLCTEDCSKQLGMISIPENTDTELDGPPDGSLEGVHISPLNSVQAVEPAAMGLIEGDIQFLNGGEEPLPLMEGNFDGILEEEEGEGEEPKEEKPAVYLQYVNDVEDSGGVQGNVRQVVTVTQDGAVEMMQVLWDEEADTGVSQVQF